MLVRRVAASLAVGERGFRDWRVEGFKAVVALVHGLAEHSGRYEHVAARLLDAGYAVVAVDLQGHGMSDGFPGDVSGLDDWLADVAELLDRAREGSRGKPLFIMGHSLGALVAATYVARNPEAVRGLVLSGTAVLAGTALLESMGDPEGQGIPPEAISRDPEVVRAYVEDPLVFADRVTPEANAGALMAAIEVNQSGPLITLPVLMVHGSEDLLGDVEGARDLFATIASRDKELIVYDGLYHEVMNEPEKDRVLDDIVAWLDRHADTG
jgi:alpha-beta hydrolase superfamily lysophospholipase